MFLIHNKDGSPPATWIGNLFFILLQTEYFFIQMVTRIFEDSEKRFLNDHLCFSNIACLLSFREIDAYHFDPNTWEIHIGARMDYHCVNITHTIVANIVMISQIISMLSHISYLNQWNHYTVFKDFIMIPVFTSIKTIWTLLLQMLLIYLLLGLKYFLLKLIQRIVLSVIKLRTRTPDFTVTTVGRPFAFKTYNIHSWSWP